MHIGSAKWRESRIWTDTPARLDLDAHHTPGESSCFLTSAYQAASLTADALPRHILKDAMSSVEVFRHKASSTVTCDMDVAH